MPVDDPIFEKTTYAQWLWYAAQFAADEKEQFELLRDIAEYNASFWNPQGVDEVRRAREKTFALSDKDFAQQVEEAFGRKLNIPNKGIVVTTEPKQPRMRNINPQTYLDMELDEVKFVPIGEKS